MNYDKTEINAFVQNLYDQKMQDGKHGHYESMFHVVHKAIELALSQLVSMEPNQEKWERRYQEVLDQNNDLKQRIAKLEQKNVVLLEALKELAAEEWRDDDDQILDRARVKARAAIQAAEVKP